MLLLQDGERTGEVNHVAVALNGERTGGVNHVAVAGCWKDGRKGRGSSPRWHWSNAHLSTKRLKRLLDHII